MGLALAQVAHHAPENSSASTNRCARSCATSCSVKNVSINKV
ncbi:MAG TPA: hypothetical protein PKZ43_08860 [Bacteroidales bacterium]|nr:hypothetical protein [Bacteroidales bacterium]